MSEIIKHKKGGFVARVHNLDDEYLVRCVWNSPCGRGSAIRNKQFKNITTADTYAKLWVSQKDENSKYGFIQ